ncbi:MAG TPA: 4-(cytidine 5'-diphospho)-2-C-methyl-D-erythritol kinase [Candidatus Bathyarchaeia archaeon]|nr:4-(cytidine 5'-diphospho)-2-C-methyl-D-erythritol kinase [Candidatus Bathyarchaeia archaeon]
MKSLRLSSPAKLNLYLKVLFKRPDGFHELRTVFERIDLKDELEFFPHQNGQIQIKCNHPQVPTGPQNLVYRAVRLLQMTCGVTHGVAVHIDKRIPVAAGLAGGSSNAATTLMALNKLWRLGLRHDELAGLAGQLGSDVAFFLYDCPWALGEGRGEKITPLDINQRFWHILVTPKRKMLTPKVYGAMNLKLTNKKDDANILIHYLKEKDINNIISFLSNDLEQSILTIAPGLGSVVKRIKGLGVKGVSFSGSGPSVYGLLSSKGEAEYLCTVLKKRYSQVFAVRTC